MDRSKAVLKKVVTGGQNKKIKSVRSEAGEILKNSEKLKKVDEKIWKSEIAVARYIKNKKKKKKKE